MVDAVCMYCGALDSDHDHQQLARDCYPKRIEAKDAEINRLRAILQAPLSSAELKLVDKHCGWRGFQHAWNAVVKSRLATGAHRE